MLKFWAQIIAIGILAINPLSADITCPGATDSQSPERN
jgi:hypothetical protein